MSTSVKVAVMLALTAVSVPTVFGSLKVQLTEAGATDPASISVRFEDISVDPATGQASVEVTFDNVAPGDFTVTATSLDNDGVQIAGFIVSSTGNVPTPEPDKVLSPVSITLTNVPGVPVV